MESLASGRVELPAAFEETPIDNLVQLIGTVISTRPFSTLSSGYIAADMLDRLMVHNDQIPLSP